MAKDKDTEKQEIPLTEWQQRNLEFLKKKQEEKREKEKLNEKKMAEKRLSFKLIKKQTVRKVISNLQVYLMIKNKKSLKKASYT